MVLAAQFRTLAIIDAGLAGIEPGFIEAPRHRVHLDAEGRHRKGVDHAGGAGRNLHAHRRIHRHNQLVVHGEQTRLVGLEGRTINAGAAGFAQNIGIEAYTLIHIFIVPVPLLAGRLDGQRRLGDVHLAEREDVGAQVFAFAIGHGQLVGQHAEGRDGDDHQDQDRHDRPDDLDQGIVGETRRHRVGLGVEAHHDDDKERQDEQHDQGDGPHQDAIVEGRDGVHDRGHGLLKMELARLRVAPADFLGCCHRRHQRQCGRRNGAHLPKELPGHHIPPIDMFWRRAPKVEGLIAA